MNTYRFLNSVTIPLLSTVLLAAIMAGCDNESSVIQPPTAETLVVKPSVTVPKSYAYSMFAPGPPGSSIIYGRIVYEALDQSCPSLFGSDGSTIVTMVRPKNPTTGGAVVSNANFPVTTCEAIIQPSVDYSDSAGNKILSSVTLNPRNVQVYGDSGCKDYDCTNGSPSAHFQALTNHGATQKPELILHMGDYNYRGTSAHFANSASGSKVYAYDAGDVPHPKSDCSYNDRYNSQNSVNSPKPDGWQYWKADFFDAAQNLLPKAPWIFARGNHELCSRAGTGWFYFFGPGSNLKGSGSAQMFCPAQGDFNAPPPDAAGRINMIEPYMVSLGDFQVWNMDSANACDDNNGNPLTKKYIQQYEQLAGHSASKAPTWVMSHRPIWGYQGGSTQQVDMLRTALKKTKAKKISDNVILSLAGHMHIYESLTFFDSKNQATTRPPQIVIGNSGVSMGGAPPTTSVMMDGQTAKVNGNSSDYGYLQMTVGAKGVWQGNIIGETGNVIVACDSSNPASGKMICQ